MLTIKNEIRDAINEELAISDIVRDKSRDITRRIKDALAEFPSVECDVVGVKRKEGHFWDSFMGKRLYVAFVYYNFLTEERMKDMEGKIDYTTCASFKLKDWNMNIKCHGISGGLNKEELSDSVQHEIEHIYQAEMGNKRISDADWDYFNVTGYMRNPDEDLRRLSEVLYFSHDYEQDGMVNGLYSLLMERGNPVPSWSDIEDSEAYIWLKKTLSNLDYIKENFAQDDFRKKCIDIFKTTPESVVKRGNAGCKRMKNKIAKVLIKVRKDFDDRGVFFRPTTNGKEQDYFF